MKLIALDLDGTLLSSNKTIRPSDRDMIFEAQNQGHIVSICSGRGIQDCLGILDDAGIDCPIISGNGAVVYDGEKIIAEYHLQPELIHEITSILIEGNVYFELYENNGIQIFSKGREILEKEIDLLSSRQKTSRLSGPMNKSRSNTSKRSNFE